MKSIFGALALATVITVAAAVPAKAEFVNYDREVVRSAQIRLGQLGYNVAYSGLSDGLTANALMDFQRSNGLPMTGLLTDATYNVLFGTRYYTVAAPAYYPSYAYAAAPAYTYYPAYARPSMAVPVAGYSTYAMPIMAIRYR